ncbi:hypothetical protein EZS27_041373 [termite gut metagenome]|uniref:DUF5681 domain-containing protein n=1 Tax=termite gut metagenome TaxID=433724 RepID=A0A5J4PCF5_9ZZZZ
MGLKKGQTNNARGRPKGKPNKVTMETREWVSQLIDKNRKQLEKDLKGLEPKDRWAVIEKLMQYAVPKMQSVEAKIGLNRLSDEQLNSIINELTDKLEDDNTDYITDK